VSRGLIGKNLWDYLNDGKKLIDQGVLDGFSDLERFVESRAETYSVFYQVMKQNHLNVLFKVWKKEELVELFETTQNKFLKYSLALVKFDDLDYVGKLSIPELYSVDEVEKCEEPIEFDLGYLTFDELIRLFKRVDEHKLWGNLKLRAYGIHDYAEAIYKGCNNKRAWTWVADMLRKHYSRNLGQIQYADIHKRFYLSKFKEFGLENHPINFEFRRNMKLPKELYFFNEIEYVRETLSFSIAFGIELTSNEWKKVSECIQRESYIPELILEKDLSSFGVTPKQLAEKFPEFFNK